MQIVRYKLEIRRKSTYFQIKKFPVLRKQNYELWDLNMQLQDKMLNCEKKYELWYKQGTTRKKSLPHNIRLDKSSMLAATEK